MSSVVSTNRTTVVPSIDDYTLTSIRHVLQSFLHHAGVPIEPSLQADLDGSLQRRVLAQFESRDINVDRYSKQIRTAVDMSSIVYCQNSLDIQVQIALYTALLLFLDDFIVPQSATAEFTTRLLEGVPQAHPLLDHIVQNLNDMAEHFPPYAAQAISTSALNFIGRTVFDTERADCVLAQDSILYVNWTRIKDGIGEAYAFFIWDKTNFPDTTRYIQAIPDVEVILDYINDLFSFYKEELLGDYQNAVHRRATVTNQHVGKALADIAEEVLAAVERVRMTLKGKERETWELFFSKYLTFHCLAPRYRLSEIIEF